MEKLALNILAIISWSIFVRAKASGPLINGSVLTLDDKDSIKISLLPESEGPIKVSDADKPILRYGFHRTQDCNNFEKAFICVRKCVDLDYQIAHADKNCVCTCYKNTVLAKYKPPVIDSEKWKLGAPTTKLPPWAGKGEPKPDDYEINANYTEFIEQPTPEGEHHEGGEHGEQHPAAEDHEAAAPEQSAPAEAEAPAEAPSAEGEAPAEEEAHPEEGEAPAEGEAAAEAPAEGEAPAEAPAEGDPPAEEAPAE